MKRKFKRWWWTILPILTKRTSISHLTLNNENKYTRTFWRWTSWYVGQSHTCGGVKPDNPGSLNIHLIINGSPTVNHLCSSSPFIYNLADHFITGDLNSINNTPLLDMSAKGPKYCERISINWRHNFKHMMDSVEDYAGNAQNLKQRR